MTNYKNEECSRLLANLLKADYTAVSYAMMVKGQLVAADALGVIDQKENLPVTTDCTFNVASVSKIYCTVAVMQLVEKGMLTLEEKVAKILTEFWMPDERYKEITVRMCLDHTSGLPGTQWKHFNLTEVGKVDYYQEVLHYLSKSHLKAAPGEYSVYCNDGFTLAEMVVAKISGMKYEDYIKLNITDPIQAHSTRLSSTINPDYPLVSEGKRPQELLLVQGAGGITTNMIDLCRFGQLFLSENKIISESSKALMQKMWGVTFLKKDQGSLEYGLGWDTVCYRDSDYDLGEHVLIKGGNSMVFTSKLIVIPKYEAVLAISETHDCGIDVQEAILRLFATWMMQQGVNITQFDEVERTCCQRWSGLYLQPTSAFDVELNHFTMILKTKNKKGKWEAAEVLNYKNDRWWNQKQDSWFFEEDEKDIYLMKEAKGRCIPMAMKARQHKPLSECWKKRIHKQYICCSISPYDLAVGQLFNAITIEQIEGYEGLMKINVHHRKENGFITGIMEMPFVAKEDNVGCGFLRTPCHGSRDLIDPFFEVAAGKEYVDVASYRFIAAEDIELYANQDFIEGEENQVFRINGKIEALPEIQEGHRVVILDESLELVYDSLDNEPFKEQEKGYIILI